MLLIKFFINNISSYKNEICTLPKCFEVCDKDSYESINGDVYLYSTQMPYCKMDEILKLQWTQLFPTRASLPNCNMSNY